MTLLQRIGFVPYTPDMPTPDHSDEDARVDAATQKALSTHEDARRAIRSSSENVTELLDGTLRGLRTS